MATFTRLRSGQWRAQVRRQGHVVSRSFRLKADAQSWAREQESRIERGQAPLTKPEMPRETFADLIDLHLTDLKELGRPIGRSKDSVRDQLRRKIGSRPIGQFTRDNLIDFAKRRAKEGAGPVTIGMDIGFIGTVLQHAAAVYGINVPSEEIRLARVALNLLGLIAKSNERDRRPTQDELDMIIATAENNPRQIIPLAHIVKVAVAMRQDEICRILIEDFNPASSTQLIRERKHPREKATNNQVIPLVADTGYDASALISEQINRTRRNGGYVFPYDGRSVGAAFRRVCRDLGIDTVGEQLEAGHVGACPANTGQNSTPQSGPEPICQKAEHRVAGNGQPDAEEIDALRIDAIRKRHQHRYREHVGAVKGCGDPSCAAVGQPPLRRQLREQRWPEERADLHERLRNAYEQHKTPG
jgi:integrase